MTRTVLLALALLATSVAAEVKLPRLFGDDMVFQRGQKVVVWGLAEPDEKVAVALGPKKAETTADEKGTWRVELDPFDAATGLKLTVNTLTFTNVAVGDVWVCSGQSNMAWPVSRARDPKKEIAAAKDAGLRFFTVPRTVSAHPATDVKNGTWVACSPESVAGFSAVAYYFGRELRRTSDVPVGLVHSSWGGTPAEAWTRRRTLAAHDDVAPILARWDKLLADYPKAFAEWQAAAKKARADGKRPPRRPLGPNHPHLPAGLFNGMIEPLLQFRIKGVIWYQGESNAGRAEQYRTLFPAMIRDWRSAWGQGDFPFLFVQLANFMMPRHEPAPSAWAELRDAQRHALTLPNTGMAVTIDIGEARDIHPKNKQEVGRRLALAARGKTGQAFDRAMFDGERVELRFKGSIRTRDAGPLYGFAIAGADKRFRWAHARIVGKNTVMVWHPAIEKPAAVRYGWADNPRCTLVGADGLPASPFRTDDWPGITAGKR